jgi:hypothetical protein
VAFVIQCIPMFRLTNLATATALAVAFAAGAAVASIGHAHADPQPALDRALVERLVRAQESQAHALDALTRAAERCR